MKNCLGMFITWGLYASTGVHEQVYARMDMEKTSYERLQTIFNPKDYDPEKWVRLAKDAGVSYICFVAKHHDGFCLWDTKYTDYSIMNTPYGKDVLKMLSEACAKHGMKLSIYYSNPDWHHPYGYDPNSTHQWKAVKRNDPDTEIYRTYIKNQITELLTNYGEIYTLFWDIPPKIYDPSINQLVRNLQPNILINDRGFDQGDFSTPEREYKAIEGARFPRMTEACNSVGVQSWGYRKDEDFYSIRHLTASIDRVMAMGGNYLLNVGPNADGVITEDWASRMRKVGEWYRRMDGCLEDTQSDPFDYQVRHDKKPISTQKNGKTYLHFPDGICSTALCLQAWPSEPKRVRLVNTDKLLPFCIEPLPEFFSKETGIAETLFLHIRDIPVDELSAEPIVIEIEWKSFKEI